MSQVFAMLKLPVNIMDPETRKIVGKDTQDMTKGFDGDTTLEEIRDWAAEQGSATCSLLFESMAPAKPGQPNLKPVRDIPEPK